MAPPTEPRGPKAPARFIGWALLALAALRIALVYVPSMAMWGLNVSRFVPPLWRWVTLGLPLVALMPALARPLARWLDALRFDRLYWRIASAAAAAALVAAYPDRVWFTGDFIGRRFSLNAAGAGLAWYTHAMPLDIAVHQRLGRMFVAGWGHDPTLYGRILGVVEAAALAWIALEFALALKRAGVAALATAAVVFWGGWLALFTGYNKALSEIVVAVALFGVLGLRVIRDDRGQWALACTLGIALLAHRSALALLPAFGVVWLHAYRHRAEGDSARSRWTAWLPLAIPAVILALLAPHLVALIGQYDVGLISAPGNPPARAAIPNTRLLDLFNVLLCLSPVAVAVLPLAFARGREMLRHPEPVFLALLTLPLGIVAMIFYPPEGLFRFWDIVAPFGMALSLFGAWLAIEIIEASTGWRWLCLALACAAACSALPWLAHDADANFGMARVRAFLDEPPSRAPELRASAYEFLGFRLVDLGRPAEAAEAFASAADIVPSPRILRQWATAEDLSGNRAGAASALEKIVERDPGNTIAWRQPAVHAEQLGDTATEVRSLRALMRLDPGDRNAQEALSRFEAAAREGQADRARVR